MGKSNRKAKSNQSAKSGGFTVIVIERREAQGVVSERHRILTSGKSYGDAEVILLGKARHTDSRALYLVADKTVPSLLLDSEWRKVAASTVRRGISPSEVAA